MCARDSVSEEMEKVSERESESPSGLKFGSFEVGDCVIVPPDISQICNARVYRSGIGGELRREDGAGSARGLLLVHLPFTVISSLSSCQAVHHDISCLNQQHCCQISADSQHRL